MKQAISSAVFTLAAATFLASPAFAGPFFFSTGSPDGLIATLSRTASPGKLETETADDFFTTSPTTLITNATFTGLLIGGATPAKVNDVEIELYHVFPIDSVNPPDGRVVTRVNSPSDNNFAAADGSLGQLSYKTKVIDPSFTAANSVLSGGIHAAPNQFTGGQGPITGEEVEFDVMFTTPFSLGPDHVFFRPEVDLGSAGDFLWLSAAKLAAPDLQSWTRDDGAGALAPDWSRIGTDITHQGPFDASFSVTGITVPEPGSLALLASAVAGLGLLRRRRWKNDASANFPTLSNRLPNLRHHMRPGSPVALRREASDARWLPSADARRATGVNPILPQHNWIYDMAAQLAEEYQFDKGRMPRRSLRGISGRVASLHILEVCGCEECK